MEKITESELNKLIDFHTRHRDAKLKVADLEIAKSIHMSKVSQIEKEYDQFNIELSNKYGEGKSIVINSSTGEITRKE